MTATAETAPAPAPAQLIRTIEEADALFASIASLECEVASLAADADEFVAHIKEDADMDMEPYRDEAKNLTTVLNSFILNNPDKFIKPRSRVTPHGKYGLRKVSALEVLDEAVLLDFARDNALEVTTVKVSLDKEKIKALLDEGWEIPGCEFEVGDVPFHKVDKSVLEKAIKENSGAY